MTRRTLIIPLHWLTAFLILAIVKGGTSAEGVRWAFVIGAGIWCAVGLVRGPLAKPGPKLQGGLRRIFTPAHWALYLILTASVVLNALALFDAVWMEAAWTSLLVLLAAGALHGLFHFWRHTALMDGALRMIFPKALHRHL